jgi:hypothetical protein
MGSGRIRVGSGYVAKPAAIFAARMGGTPKRSGDTGSVKKRRARRFSGQAKVEREQAPRIRARDLEKQRREFFKNRAPAPAALDELKAQFRAKMKG